jgi:hypothetical protein
VTGLGWVLLAILLAGVVVAAAGPGSVQPFGLLAVVAVGIILFGGGLSGRGRRRTGKTLAQRRAEFGPRARRFSQDPASAGGDDVWQRERERREQTAATTQVATAEPQPESELPDLGL